MSRQQLHSPQSLFRQPLHWHVTFLDARQAAVRQQEAPPPPCSRCPARHGPYRRCYQHLRHRRRCGPHRPASWRTFGRLGELGLRCCTRWSAPHAPTRSCPPTASPPSTSIGTISAVDECDITGCWLSEPRPHPLHPPHPPHLRTLRTQGAGRHPAPHMPIGVRDARPSPPPPILSLVKLVDSRPFSPAPAANPTAKATASPAAHAPVPVASSAVSTFTSSAFTFSALSPSPRRRRLRLRGRRRQRAVAAAAAAAAVAACRCKRWIRGERQAGAW